MTQVRDPREQDGQDHSSPRAEQDRESSGEGISGQGQRKGHVGWVPLGSSEHRDATRCGGHGVGEGLAGSPGQEAHPCCLLGPTISQSLH